MRNATKVKLLDVERRVRPAGRTVAPTVNDPPTGYEVIGSLDVGAVTAQNLDVNTYPLEPHDPYRTGPGNPEAYRRTWGPTGGVSFPVGGQIGLTVLTLPSQSLDAVPGSVALASGGDTRHVRRVNVGGRPGFLLSQRFSGSPYPDPYERVLYSNARGNLVIVVARDLPCRASTNSLVSPHPSLRSTRQRGKRRHRWIRHQYASVPSGISGVIPIRLGGPWVAVNLSRC